MYVKFILTMTMQKSVMNKDPCIFVFCISNIYTLSSKLNLSVILQIMEVKTQFLISNVGIVINCSNYLLIILAKSHISIP